MNKLGKMGVSLISFAAMSLAGCSASPSSTLPALAEVTAQTSQQIASDLHYEMAAAKQLPRAVSTIRTASVEIEEMVDVVVVAASRLPAIEHFADVAAAQTPAF